MIWTGRAKDKPLGSGYGLAGRKSVVQKRCNRIQGSLVGSALTRRWYVMVLWMNRLKGWARSLKRDVVALWLAARDIRTPLMAKVVAGMVAAYALSPIDLIPDVIPVLGYVDDLLIVPFGIALAIRMIPSPLMVEFRRLADSRTERPMSRAGMLAVIMIWVIAALLAIWGFNAYRTAA